MLSVQIQLRCLSPRALSELRVLCGQKTATDSCSAHDAFVSSFLGHNAAFRVGTVRLAGLSRRHKATKILIGTWFRSSLRTAPVATATTDGQPYRLSLRLRRRPSGGTRSSYWLYRGWRGCCAWSIPIELTTESTLLTSVSRRHRWWTNGRLNPSFVAVFVWILNGFSQRFEYAT